MRGMRPELRLILPVVFVFDSGPRAPEGTSGSQFGCMVEALSDTVKPDAGHIGSLIRQVE
jgi:hypothetical protein